jgi:uncharacterized protein (DUF1810 family)
VSPSDPYRLDRFVRAQGDGTYERALAEVRRGRKDSHWMWFVFPQLAGLGRSAMAREYAIGSIDEARAYLAHPVLGPWLLEITRATLEAAEPSAERVFGGIDALKLRSSMTLFAIAAPDVPEFSAVLARSFEGEPDPATERLLAG